MLLWKLGLVHLFVRDFQSTDNGKTSYYSVILQLDGQLITQPSNYADVVDSLVAWMPLFTDRI